MGAMNLVLYCQPLHHHIRKALQSAYQAPAAAVLLADRAHWQQHRAFASRAAPSVSTLSAAQQQAGLRGTMMMDLRTNSPTKLRPPHTISPSTPLHEQNFVSSTSSPQERLDSIAQHLDHNTSPTMSTPEPVVSPLTPPSPPPPHPFCPSTTERFCQAEDSLDGDSAVTTSDAGALYIVCPSWTRYRVRAEAILC